MKLNKNCFLVSVIMPAYNCQEYIVEAIKSVMNQSYNDWELIVIDDFSKDATGELARRLAHEDNRIKYVRLEVNSGAATARNKGIDLASGKFIAFLDSDDIWHEDKLKTQIDFMIKNNHYFSCTAYNKIDENGNDLNKVIEAKLESDYDGILKKCPGNSTVVYDAEKLGKFFIPNIRKRNDYVMWLQLIKKAGKLYGINKVLSSHRIRPNSISHKKIDLIFYHWKVYRDIEKLNFFQSLYLINYWIIVSLWRNKIN